MGNNEVPVSFVLVEKVDGAGRFQHCLNKAQIQKNLRKKLELFGPEKI